MKENFKDYLLDPSKDYRRELSKFKVNLRGDLLIMRNNRWESLIKRERLTDDDWISHERTKLDIKDFGEFVCAYLKALERLGIKNLRISIYGFNDSCKYADGE
jgi:hypothetical protein